MAIFKCMYCPRLKIGPQQPYMSAMEVRWVCEVHRSHHDQRIKTVHILAVKELRPTKTKLVKIASSG